MAATKHWIAQTIEQADKCDTKMPWERGARRQEMISRRLAQTDTHTKVTLPPMPAFMTMAVAG